MSAIAAAPEVYTGPRPSPARRWAPYVIALGAVMAFVNALKLFLNLLERHYQQRIGQGSPPAASEIHDTLQLLRHLDTIANIGVVVVLIVAVVWGGNRRNRARLAQLGEAGVEPRLYKIALGWYITFWVALAVSFIVGQIGSAAGHGAATAADFARYRGYRAIVNAAQVALWTSYVAMVVRSTRRQVEREARTVSQPVS